MIVAIAMFAFLMQIEAGEPEMLILLSESVSDAGFHVQKMCEKVFRRLG